MSEQETAILQVAGVIQGPPGDVGQDGKSAYQLAVENGFKGTEAEWLASLKGQKGDPGQNATTPHIGENGNWYIGENDTGKPSRGQKGAPGQDGKTAYQYAVEGGYQGTETEFAEQMADEHNYAPAIVNEAIGASIVVSDSAERKLRGMTLYGKSRQVKTNGYQLFDASKIQSKTMGGVTLTNNGDGSFTIGGEAISTSEFRSDYIYSVEETKELLKIGRLYKVETNSNSMTSPNLSIALIDQSGNIIPEKGIDTTKPSGSFIEVTQEDFDKGCRLKLNMHTSNGTAISVGHKIRPMLYQDGDGTWEPYTGGKPSPNPDYPQEIETAGEDGGIESSIHGYQLFDASKMATKSQGGATVTNNGDGSFTITGSGNLTSQFHVDYKLTNSELTRLLRKGFCTIDGIGKTNPYMYFKIYDPDSNKVYHEFNKFNTSKHVGGEWVDEKLIAQFGFYGVSGETITSGTIKPILYQDGDGTWEPYNQPQPLTIPTPNGLSGIPVTSNGNYTDETGQQWICDEIDLKRGKYVQRVWKVIIDENSHIKRNASVPNMQYPRFDYTNDDLVKQMSSKFKETGVCNTLTPCSNPITNNAYDESISAYWSEGSNGVYFRFDRFKTVEELKAWLVDTPIVYCYPLATPIESDLDQETIAAYKKLHTNYPNTVITNDAGVDMNVKYIADTKEYVVSNEEYVDTMDKLNPILEEYHAFGYVEHMDILSPSNRIEYTCRNKNYTAMSMDLSTHTTNYGSWSEFPSLVHNKPYMVKATGEEDYALNPDDYMKKASDGSKSDVDNTAYNGGAFSKFIKVYVKRWIDGNDKHVRFSYVPLEGYKPCGFIDTNKLVMDYVWLPMFYGSTVDGKMRSLSGLQPNINQNTATQYNNITAFSDRAAFFGGPIVETIRDMLVMLFKTTDLQSACGKGNCSGYNSNASPYYGVLPNAVVNGGQFYGSSDAKSLNKIFHSIVLGSYQQWQRDPYYLVVNGRYKVSTDYTYDVTGTTYIDTGINSETVNTDKWLYPTKCKVVDEFGSIPVPPFNGSTSTGYCDGVYHPKNKNFTAVVLRFGRCPNGSTAGPGALALDGSAAASNWHLSASVLLRPPVAA